MTLHLDLWSNQKVNHDIDIYKWPIKLSEGKSWYKYYEVPYQVMKKYVMISIYLHSKKAQVFNATLHQMPMLL